MQIAMLAADFTPGEADALRRAMAAWKRKGGLGPVPRAAGRPHGREGLRRASTPSASSSRSRASANTASPRATPPALRCWSTSALDQVPPPRCLPGRAAEQPADGLLRAGAAGARRARARRRGAAGGCAAVSEWRARSRRLRRRRRRAGQALLWPVRLGLNRIGGLDAGGRRAAASPRAPRRLSRAPKTWRAAPRSTRRQLRCWRRPMRCVQLTGHRHQAAWAVAGVDTRATRCCEARARTRPRPRSPRRAWPRRCWPTTARTGLSLNTPPAGAAARAAGRVPGAAGGACCAAIRNGQLARASGLVTHRQRPETAKGMVFVTLEDETGAVNVIVWPDVAEAQRKPLLGSTLLTVYGVWQREGEGERAVMHLIARKLVDHSPLLQGPGHAQPQFPLRPRSPRRMRLFTSRRRSAAKITRMQIEYLSQAVTPELREWILAQAQAGCAADDILAGHARQRLGRRRGARGAGADAAARLGPAVAAAVPQLPARCRARACRCPSPSSPARRRCCACPTATCRCC